MDKRCLYSCNVAVVQFRPLTEPSSKRSAERNSTRDILVAYCSLLKGCTKRGALAEGRRLHESLINEGIEPDVQLATALISFYTRFGRMSSAREVFEKLPNPDLLAWNMMIIAYAKCGPVEDAFKLFNAMESKCISPNEVTFVGIITAAVNILDLEKGKQIHMYIVKIAFNPNIFMNNALVDMYAKCGCIFDASRIFDQMTNRDTVSWNTMIGGLTKYGFAEEAFAWFALMTSEGVIPNDVTFLSLMNACAILKDLELGKQLHFQLGNHKIGMRPSLSNALIDMYCKCGSLKDAQETLDLIPLKDEISWNAIIGGHVKNGHVGKVSMLCYRMMAEASHMNEITFLSVLNACATVGDLRQGKRAHACIDDTHVVSNVFLCSALVDMYAKCGNLDKARKLFDRSSKQNIVLWTAIISGYARHGQAEEAFKLFNRMEVDKVRPNEVTFVSLLDACTSLGNLEMGQVLHSYISELHCRSNTRLENALINMYTKCGGIDDALQIFDHMNQRDLVSWTSLIAGYVLLELFDKAFCVFGKMTEGDVKPDGVTFVTMSNACASIAGLEQGSLIHTCVVASGIAVDAFIGNSLIDMYAKCGSLREAEYILDKLLDRDIISWNTMLSGCAQYGHGTDLLLIAKQMQEDGVVLNQITFLSVLSAFGRSGLLNEAFQVFVYMTQEKHITAVVEHYACIIDLIARAGHLNEAVGCILMMPFQPSATGWGALLGACKLHDLVHLAEFAADQILQLEPENSAVYIVMSNIYAAS